MTFAQWDPKNCTVSFAGIPLSGFASGTFIKIGYKEEQITETVGSQGDVVRIFNRNEVGTCEITLQASSPCNDLLLARHQRDKRTRDGYGPFLAEDLNGTSRARGPRAWISKVPEIEWATDPTDRVWIITIGNLDLEPGGAVIA